MTVAARGALLTQPPPTMAATMKTHRASVPLPRSVGLSALADTKLAKCANVGAGGTLGGDGGDVGGGGGGGEGGGGGGSEGGGEGGGGEGGGGSGAASGGKGGGVGCGGEGGGGEGDSSPHQQSRRFAWLDCVPLAQSNVLRPRLLEERRHHPLWLMRGTSGDDP